MNDLWADVRVKLEFARLGDIVRLLADADALLAVVPAMKFARDRLALGGYRLASDQGMAFAELEKALAALPKHLQ